MTLLYLIRHGRTAWNDLGRMQGWSDQPLDDHGRAQAQALARRLSARRFAAIYSSPLLRARATAEIVAAWHGLPVRLDDRLQERNLGEWTGLTFEEARARQPERLLGNGWRLLGPPGGDTQASLAARVSAAFDAIVAAHPDETVAVVSHGGALSAYLGHLLGVSPERNVSFAFHNTAVARVSVRPAPDGQGNDVRLLALGDDHHLRPE